MEGKKLKEIETPQLTSANLYFTGKIKRRGELATGIGRRAYAVAIENDKIQHRIVIHFLVCTKKFMLRSHAFTISVF
jgi:hypothetical protein